MTKRQFVIILIVCLIIACLFFFVPSNILSIIYFRFIAVAFIAMGIIKLAFTNLRDEKKELVFNLCEGFLAIILGVVYFHFYTYLTIDIICFVLLAVIPILRLIFAEKKINQIGFDFLKYVGIVSMLAGYSVVNKPFFIFCGVIFVGIAIAIVVLYVRGRRKNEQED